MPFGETQGIAPGVTVVGSETSAAVPVGDDLIGRVLDALGNPLDDGPRPILSDLSPLLQTPPNPVTRRRIDEVFETGVRTIDSLLTLGSGQRVGIMAGSGVGKSTLLGMVAKHSSSDIAVVGLIGERGREVREFIERDLGEEGLRRSVVVVATSDQSPLLRQRGAVLAATISEYFRDEQQADVLLLMDSVTRFCMAQREIGLSLGEPPATKGYPPSVFANLPRLLERAGTGARGGSITGIYTVLVEGDDLDDPVADSARAILDGHIVLSRKLAQRNQFPAIDVLMSASRVMRSVIDERQHRLSSQIKEWMALYHQSEDLIQVGAYTKGLNQRVDQAILAQDRILQFLRQDRDEATPLSETIARMEAINSSSVGQ
jgi:flagellum-specific ATP synthase